jgi:hypothetical protein
MTEDDKFIFTYDDRFEGKEEGQRLDKMNMYHENNECAVKCEGK